MVIGVLALQGDVREHVRALDEAGATARPVRRLSEIESADGLVIPGGESTTLWKLATAFDLLDPIRKLIADGMPAFATASRASRPSAASPGPPVATPSAGRWTPSSARSRSVWTTRGAWATRG